MTFDCPVSGLAPLTGRVALVTGVSRRNGIRFAVAKRLISLGASIMVHHDQPHDLVQAWGGDDLAAVLDELRDHQRRHDDQSAHLDDHSGDLAATGAPELLALIHGWILPVTAGLKRSNAP